MVSRNKVGWNLSHYPADSLPIGLIVFLTISLTSRRYEILPIPLDRAQRKIGECKKLGFQGAAKEPPNQDTRQNDKIRITNFIIRE